MQFQIVTVIKIVVLVAIITFAAHKFTRIRSAISCCTDRGIETLEKQTSTPYTYRETVLRRVNTGCQNPEAYILEML